jgi:hypothetical protein
MSAIYKRNVELTQQTISGFLFSMQLTIAVSKLSSVFIRLIVAQVVVILSY